MSQTIKLSAADGHSLDALTALPAGQPRGGLVVIHDFMSFTPYLESVCAAYAAEGYAVAAPALYDRQAPGARFDRDPAAQQQAASLRKGLQWDEVMLDVDAARVHLQAHGKCGIVGFCMGGSVVWLAASKPGFDAAISYYGKDVPDWLDKKPLCPVILHFGENDALIPLDGVRATAAACPDVPVYTYAAGHAFDNPATGASADIVSLARKRSLDLLRQWIG